MHALWLLGPLTATLSTPAVAAEGPIFSRWEARVGASTAGPVLFNDAPDQRIEPTTAFEYGGQGTFLFGRVDDDFYRFGLGVGYAGMARSASRNMRLLTPRAVFETGGVFHVQAGLGYAVTLGTDGFTEHYDGVYSRLALRRDFRDPDSESPMGVALGLCSDFIASTESMRYSSAFVGAEIDVIFHGGK
jgi:hypothetical protein